MKLPQSTWVAIALAAIGVAAAVPGADRNDHIFMNWIIGGGYITNHIRDVQFRSEIVTNWQDEPWPQPVIYLTNGITVQNIQMWRRWDQPQKPRSEYGQISSNYVAEIRWDGNLTNFILRSTVLGHTNRTYRLGGRIYQ